MHKRVAVLGMALAVVLGPAVPASAQADPPRGPCNRGTAHAHATVPHHTEGNMTAHEHIPHCPH